MFKPASQAGQDLFVYRILKNKRDGTYLDVGAGNCIAEFRGDNCGSNTLRLADMGWTGVGIDTEKNYVWGWQHIRRHKFITEDATTLDWDKLIAETPILQKTVDYLSFNLDDATTAGVKHFPFDKIKFRVITIEHDSYRVGDEVKKLIRDILPKFGYELLCSDVSVQITGYKPWIYEDWWVDPNTVDMTLANKFRADKTLGSEIAHRDTTDNITIPVSVGEALDKLSILYLKKEFITEPNKLVEIRREIDAIYPLIQSYVILYEKLFKLLLDINRDIWIMSEDIRKIDKKSPVYGEKLVTIMEKNDQRYQVKAQINSQSNSTLKEQKSYVNTAINYVCGGKLGDLIHSIYVIMVKYLNTGQKGNLYITDKFLPHHGQFTTGVAQTYKELYNIIMAQDYINSFHILDASSPPENYVDISAWYKSPLLFRVNWCQLVSSSCGVPEIPRKWLTLPNTNASNTPLVHEKIIIHRKPIPDTNFPWETILTKNKCTFATCNMEEYDNFKYKHLVQLQLCSNLEEFVNVINNAKFFIGNQSSPLAFACALHKPCLVELLDYADSVHYKGETKNNPNFFWIQRNSRFTPEEINKFIQL